MMHGIVKIGTHLTGVMGKIAVYWPGRPEPTRDNKMVKESLLNFLRLFQTIVMIITLGDIIWSR